MSSISRVSAQRNAALFTTSVSAISIALLSPASAQQSASPNVLPTLVVSATSVPTPAAEIASTVTVITSEDIEREQRRTISDVLANVPGLNVVQAGGPGRQTSVFMRGTESNHTKVLIDGIDASDPSVPGGLFDFAHITVADVERIEVLRGPQSGLYGADAIGGVISIVTKKGNGPPKVAARIEGGSLGTSVKNGSVSGSQGAFDYAFNVNHFRSTGHNNVPVNLFVPGRQNLTDIYDNLTYSTKLGAQLNDSFRINAVARYTDADLGVVVSPGDPRTRTLTRQLFTRGEAVWSGFDGRHTSYFGVNYSDHWRYNLSPGAASVPAVFTGDRTRFDWRGVTTVLPGHTLITGAEHEIIRGSNSTIFAENNDTAGYAELQSKFGERIFVTGNIRHDDNARFGGHTTYRVAPSVILPGSETRLKASVGTGFKAPSLDELFFDIPAFGFLANPNLRPESSIGYDAGFEQPLFNDRVRFGATYFNNELKDLINFQFNPDFTGTLVNIDRARTSGVEVFASAQVTDTVRVRVDYTHTDAIDLATNLELLRRPKEKVSATAIWEALDNLTLSGTILHVGESVDAARVAPFVDRPILPAYTVVNLAGDYRVDQHLKVFARIDNLFDLRYENPYGFQRPGFGIYGGFRLTN